MRVAATHLLVPELTESTRYYQHLWRTWRPTVETVTSSFVAIVMEFGRRKAALLLVTEPHCDAGCFERNQLGRLAPRLGLCIQQDAIEDELADLDAMCPRIWMHVDDTDAVRLAEITDRYRYDWVLETSGPPWATILRSMPYRPKPRCR